ncbi:DUF4230 domain-containing protein [Peptoniphilus obesi]|uniref:DUF4230 domain-containing protein n=1 Tax=Peptoniphilus obesi TaxID=1472765 RepID=UPI0004AD2CBC|nr:DUF4230 domain-containing protein [Peptoniphilus obesi]
MYKGGITILKFSYKKFSLLLFVICIFLFLGLSLRPKEKTEIDSNIIKNKLVSVQELTTVKYNYTNMGQFENSNTFYGYKIPFTSKKFIISYDGSVNIGVNLADMDVTIDSNKIKIKLDHAKILSHEIYEDSLKIFDEQNSIFNPIRLEDYNNFSKSQKKKIENEIIEKGLLEKADEKTKKAIYDILNIDDLLEKYSLEIEFK